MSFGLPYKGSKNIYAKLICQALPSGQRFVDLFAGGCAITDCAIKKFNHKWNKYLVNDICHEAIDLYRDCLNGQNPVSWEWLSRDDFKTAPWATKLVWSFGNNMKSYLYGAKIENIKYDIDYWIRTGNKSNKSDILSKIELPIDLNSFNDRYYWWVTHKKELDFMGIDLQMQRLQALERLNRLQEIKQEILPNINYSYIDYKDYEYLEGDVVYCDIPYYKTHCEQYQIENDFDHAAFWSWAKTAPFAVYVSERTVPDDVEILLERKIPNRANHKGTDGFSTEFLVKV